MMLDTNTVKTVTTVNVCVSIHRTQPWDGGPLEPVYAWAKEDAQREIEKALGNSELFRIRKQACVSLQLRYRADTGKEGESDK